jgi:hypothetical protein
VQLVAVQFFHGGPFYRCGLTVGIVVGRGHDLAKTVDAPEMTGIVVLVTGSGIAVAAQ